jgi:E3 ubiquitin-protein ligase DOA10
MTEYECRICFDSSKNIDEFISPCCCIGTQQHIHKDCLNKWFEANQGNDKYFRCQDCHCYYNRSGDQVKKEKVEFNTNISILAITALSTSFLIFLLILCGISKLLCTIILVCIYLISIVYVATFDAWLYWIVIIFAMIGLWSNFKIKTFITDLWLIVAFGVSSYHFLDGGWNYIYDQVDRDHNKNVPSQMYDRFLGRYVNGVF